MQTPATTLQTRCRADLEALFAAYTAHTGLDATPASTAVLGERTMFNRFVRQGGSIRVVTYDAIIARFSAIWPDDLRWPKGVTRHDDPGSYSLPAMKLNGTTGDDPASRERARLARIAAAKGIPFEVGADEPAEAEA